LFWGSLLVLVGVTPRQAGGGAVQAPWKARARQLLGFRPPTISRHSASIIATHLRDLAVGKATSS
jgi:hypothetical protein